MAESICKFVPQKELKGGIKTVRFVYETEWYTLPKSQISPIYFLAIVTRGTGTLHANDCEYSLRRGDLFFIPPATAFSLSGERTLAYIYLTFLGADIPSLLARMGITGMMPYFPDREALCPVFENAIRRADSTNIALLSESTLQYALSFLASTESGEEEEERPFASILNYVEAHFSDKGLSLHTLAEQFSYTEKYLSALFKKCVGTGFNEHLNALRIQRASLLIEQHFGSVAEIAEASGYKDASYFSKVFKKRTGVSPTQMLVLANADHKRAKTK